MGGDVRRELPIVLAWAEIVAPLEHELLVGACGRHNKLALHALDTTKVLVRVTRPLDEHEGARLRLIRRRER